MNSKQASEPKILAGFAVGINVGLNDTNIATLADHLPKTEFTIPLDVFSCPVSTLFFNNIFPVSFPLRLFVIHRVYARRAHFIPVWILTVEARTTTIV